MSHHTCDFLPGLRNLGLGDVGPAQATRLGMRQAVERLRQEGQLTEYLEDSARMIGEMYMHRPSWLEFALCSSFPPFFFCFLLSIHFGTLGPCTFRVLASHEVNYD